VGENIEEDMGITYFGNFRSGSSPIIAKASGDIVQHGFCGRE
jgi:hypothetical protein